MSEMVPAFVFELHVARSDFIDGYNAADHAVRERMKLLKVPDKQLAGANIEALLKVPANPQYSKVEKKRVDEQLAELRRLQPVRCDIVHSQLQALLVDGAPNAMFCNVQQTPRIGRTGLMLTLEEIRQCTNSLHEIACELRKVEKVPLHKVT
jgi:hypothetical protein